MARYQLTKDVFGKPPTEPAQLFKMGQTICSDLASQKEGDIWWPALCGDRIICRPLDTAGSAIMGVPVYPLDLKNYAKVP